MIVIKFLIAFIIAFLWYFFSGGDIENSGTREVSIILFIFIFSVLLIRFKKSQNIEDKEDFKEKVNYASERKLKLEKNRILEKKAQKEKENLKEL